MCPIARKWQNWGLNSCLSEEPRPSSSGLPFAWSVTSGMLLVAIASFWEIRYSAALPNNGLEASFSEIENSPSWSLESLFAPILGSGKSDVCIFKNHDVAFWKTKWTINSRRDFFFLMPLLWELMLVLLAVFLGWQTYIIVVTCFWDTEDENRNKIWTFQVSTWVTYINDREKWSQEKEF